MRFFFVHICHEQKESWQSCTTTACCKSVLRELKKKHVSAFTVWLENKESICGMLTTLNTLQTNDNSNDITA